jgi:hypothetical protein
MMTPTARDPTAQARNSRLVLMNASVYSAMGLVRVRADGSQRLYRVDTEQVAEVRAALERFWGARLGRLSAAVAASREGGKAGGSR